MCNLRAIADAKDVRVHCDRRHAERCVQHHVCGLASDARQGFKLLSVPRNLSVELLDQDSTRRDDVLGFISIETNGSDEVLKFLFTEFKHFVSRVCYLEKFSSCSIH